MVPRRLALVVAGCAALALAPSAQAVKRRAFVSSTSGTGNLASWPDAGGQGALAAGDNICRARAQAAGLPDAQAYRAWLSTASTDAYCHVQGLTGKKSAGCSGAAQPAGPWFRANGSTTFTGSLVDLTGSDPQIFRPVLTDELGHSLTVGDRIWTGTGPTGEVSTHTCTSWVVGTAGATGTSGLPTETAVDWTLNTYFDCNSFHHLLCMEPGASETVVLPWSAAAVVFTTSAYGSGNLGSWPQAGGATGLAAGDAICRTLATEADLPVPESFVAWLSSGSTDAADRLTLANTTFRRLDHYGVASSKADLLAVGGNANTFHVDEWGRYLADHVNVWTGTDADGDRDPANCANWTVGDGSEEGMFGTASSAYDGSWTEFTPVDCHQPMRLYCFSNQLTIFWDGFEITADTSRWSATSP
jgi:hypothetical protein